MSFVWKPGMAPLSDECMFSSYEKGKIYECVLLIWAGPPCLILFYYRWSCHIVGARGQSVKLVMLVVHHWASGYFFQPYIMQAKTSFIKLC